MDTLGEKKWSELMFKVSNYFKLNITSLFTDIVFPKVTKCHFHKYGASGSIQKHDGN